MRLNPRERDVIVTAAGSVFGPGTRVLLFGSRTNDTEKGGDIDLLVKPGILLSPEENLKRKIAMLISLEQELGEQKIDILLQYPADKRPIVLTALKTGIPLC